MRGMRPTYRPPHVRTYVPELPAAGAGVGEEEGDVGSRRQMERVAEGRS